MTHDKKWKNFAVVVEVAAIVGFILRFQDNDTSHDKKWKKLCRRR